MGEFKMSRNSSGYYDETAYKAISGAAKSGEIWEYSNNYGTNQMFLIIKNHGNICTALRLVDEPTAECVEVYEMHTDPRMLQYIYNTNLARYVHSLSAGEFRSILDTISECLNIKIEAKTPTDGAEKAKPQAKEAVNHPAHYQGKHECIDEMIAMFGVESVKHFCMCNVYKYRFRAALKNGQEDIKKAEWYMDKLMELEREHHD